MNKGIPATLRVIDSHTGGEPTRVVIDGGPDMGRIPLSEMRDQLASQHDWIRSTCLQEPRGFEAMVGALLVPAHSPDCVTGVIFFNNTGYLNMCIHGVVGLAVTLQHMGLINQELSSHRIDTPVGVVTITFNDDESVSVTNVGSYRFKKSVAIQLPNYGEIEGDIAWGGNWFFIINDQGPAISELNIDELVKFSSSVRNELKKQQITGTDGTEIDHIELTSRHDSPHSDSRNFVMCPGGEYDRSPCGTGTSAKLACLFADGLLRKGEMWRQAGILNTVFRGIIIEASEGAITPQITASAWVNGETQIILNPKDPFIYGITKQSN